MTESIGIDVGGTFTDLVGVRDDGSVRTGKVLSTPADQSEGVERSLREAGARAGSVSRIVHGTTVVTNLLLERKGARVVLCATEGAEDVLFLRRQDRAALYDLSRHHPPALVAREDVIAVPERRTPRGMERALTDAGIASVVAEVLNRKPEIVVVALLHAYADDAHEQRLAAAIKRASPDLEVVTSADVLRLPA